MFTGIIEAQSRIESIEEASGKRIISLRSPLAREFKVDQSVAHDGVCLTVEKVQDDGYQVTAIPQTLALTTVGSWQVGQSINLERALLASARLDGHFVQGHVDGTGEILSVQSLPGEWRYTIQIPSGCERWIIAQGSIAVNGISLTVAELQEQSFKVAIIPYTYEHTNVQHWQKKGLVNLEFDVLGKYVDRLRQF